MSEKLRQSQGSDIVRGGRIKTIVGRIIDWPGVFSPSESRQWEMDTGEGAAIAAGAEDLEDLDIDTILSPEGGQLAAVRRAVNGGFKPEGGFVHEPRLSEDVVSPQAIQ